MKKKKSASALTGAVSTGLLPGTIGIYDYRVLAGCAIAGGIAGWFGVDLAGMVKRKWRER